MPPRPLNNLSTARAHPGDTQNLTPRTPHSRAGRAEEAFTEIELAQFGDDEYQQYTVAQQQTEPLLASSTSDSFPPSGLRVRGDEDVRPEARKSAGILKWALANSGLVLGSGLALALFLLIIISYKRPEALLHVIGELNVTASTSSPVPSSTLPAHADDILADVPASADTISYANYTHFPLDPMEYRAECHKLTGDMMKPMPYWSDHMHNDVVHHDQIDPGTYPLPEGERTQICSKTITYMLDGHVGLLADLALMAQVAGLAREVKRTFLVDDTYWNRGKWTDHFQDVRARQPGPEPGCRAPPPEELVACPRTARHWVVNSRTAKYHFGHGFFNEFEDPYAREINRLKPIYARARESLTKTLRPNAANAALISSARVEFDSLLPPTPPTPPGATPRDPGRYISVHIRRGDLNGTSWKYHSQHVATREYSAGISDSWDRLFLNGSSPAEKASLTPVVYLASDSPSVVSELRPLLKPGSTVFSLSQSRSPALRELASPGEYIQHEFNGLPAEDRVRLTRGMVVDFAMLSGFWAWDDEVKPGAVVCAIGSNICKMSAVGLEWNRAFGHGFKDNQDGEIDEQHKRWVEVDQKGAVEPVWEAFEVFQ